MGTSVGIATCAQLPHGDEDFVLLADHLRTLGVTPISVIWDQPAPPATVDLMVIRSTWDYTEHLGAFLEWAGSLARVENPTSVIRWNTDKRYLDDLATASIPTIPTTYACSGEDLVVPASERFVVKPTVGAGSKGALLLDAGEIERARAHVDGLSALNKVSMIQPYLAEVEERGETGVILIDGRPAHAIEKGLMLVADAVDDDTGLSLLESIRLREATPAELDLAIATHAAACAHLGLNAPLLYSRVDLLPGPDGPTVIEFEATEPSLFLRLAPTTAALLAEAIARRLNERSA